MEEPKDRKVIASILSKDNRVKDFYCKLRNKFGKILDAEISIEYIEIKDEKHFLTIVRDVTEKKRAEEERQKLEKQFFHAQKMESIGRLAGGIAHDFNNVLTSILGYAELLQAQYTDKDSKLSVDVILKGVERASSLTKQLLGFARGGKYYPEPTELNSLIKNVLKMLDKIFEKSIIIKFNLKETPFILADQHQIDQVLTNLFINAKDAMPNGGKLYIETDQFSINSEEAKYYDNIKPGNYVKLAIEDTGIGIPKGIINRILNHFFQLKAKKKVSVWDWHLLMEL